MFFTIFSFTIVVFICFRSYLKSRIGRYDENCSLDGKTVIVTGSDSGIGLYCARNFAKRGAKVILLSCDLENGIKVKNDIILESGNTNVKVKFINFSNLETVRKCAYEILDEESHIHVLLNNAGVANIGIYLSVDNLDTVTQINYFGPFLFTNILMDRIVSSAPSRIVNVSSHTHWFGKLDLDNFAVTNTTNEYRLYANTKLAITCFTLELSERLKGTGVTVNCLHPGLFYSRINQNLHPFVGFLWRIIIKLFFKTVEEAAQTSIFLCVSPDVQHVSGKYFEDCKISTPPKSSFNVDTRKKLWNLSEISVNIKSSSNHTD